jgi:putative protease
MCREKGAGLHAALNTIPGAGEISPFLDTVAQLEENGVLAVILSDPGVISLVRREVPSLRITASVGLSTLNPAEARFYREVGADAVVLPTALAPGEIPAIKEESGLRVEVFVHCRPEILLQGTCALPGYTREGQGVPGRPQLSGSGTLSSAKRTGRCHLVCRAIPLSREPHSIERELASWVSAGVDAFKLQGRELSPSRLFELTSRIRGKLDAAVAAVARKNPA